MHLNLRLRKFTPTYHNMTLSVYVYEEPDKDYYSFIYYTTKKGKITKVKHDLLPDIEILLPLVVDVVDKPQAVLMDGVATYNLIYR